VDNTLQFFDEGSADYVAAFQTLIRCNQGGERALLAMVDAVCAGRPRATRSVDWGAGAGRLTRRLCARFDVVYAVEPSALMRQQLAQAAPAARLIDGTLATATLPEPCDVALLSHVLYHVPDDLWGATVLRCARRLTDGGTLLIVMKHPESDCNAMIEAFGGARFDLYRIADTFRRHPEYTLELRAARGRLVTSSLADTLAVARFMLCDRTPAGYEKLPTEREFASYVRAHFWDEQRGQGGWSIPQVFALVRRNLAWTS
jgi:SAM-dependent methyltransferase